MKTRCHPVSLALLLPALLLLVLPLQAQTLERTFEVSAGEELDLQLETGGDIHVEGWSKEEVFVEVIFKGKGQEEIDVDFQPRSNGVAISARREGRSRRNQRGSAEFRVRVPHRFDVRLESMGGDVHLTGIEGELEGQTMGGQLVLRDLKGHIDLKTMGGAIRVENTTADGRVETMGGAVTMTNVQGGLDAHTMGGAVTYQGGQAGSTSGPVRVRTMGGAIQVDHAPGGAEVETMGGAIHIGEAGQHVRAKTYGGRINIEAVDGWVEAETMGGAVTVEMVGDPDDGDRHVQLSSLGGDIELTVPEGLDMDIMLEVEYTDDADETYRIVSDFQVEQQPETQWEDDNGRQRHRVRASGRAGQGTHRIHIKTINGNITLNRR